MNVGGGCLKSDLVAVTRRSRQPQGNDRLHEQHMPHHGKALQRESAVEVIHYTLRTAA